MVFDDLQLLLCEHECFLALVMLSIRYGITKMFTSHDEFLLLVILSIMLIPCPLSCP